MSVSENIRSLARDGLSTAEIARRLEIRYQHAYNVLRGSGMLSVSNNRTAATGDTPSHPPVTLKPALLVEELVRSGFEHSGRWVLSDSGALVIDRQPPQAAGIYAFAKNEHIVYVGVATMGLAKRLYSYIKPGPTQRTNQRINDMLKNELRSVPCIAIYTATPPDSEWNGLPVNVSVGLELGLIKRFALPWNIRSAN